MLNDVPEAYDHQCSIGFVTDPADTAYLMAVVSCAFYPFCLFTKRPTDQALGTGGLGTFGLAHSELSEQGHEKVFGWRNSSFLYSIPAKQIDTLLYAMKWSSTTKVVTFLVSVSKQSLLF
jgi:hypothetical protein